MPLDRAAPEAFHRLIDHWRQLRGSQKAPLRAQLDPAEIGYELSKLALTEIAHEPFRVRYRVVGSNLTELYGGPMVGRYVGELYGPRIRDDATAAYRQVVETAERQYKRRRFRLFSIAFGYDRLILPLSRTGERIDMALLPLYPCAANIRSAADWRSLVEVPPEWIQVD